MPDRPSLVEQCDEPALIGVARCGVDRHGGFEPLQAQDARRSGFCGKRLGGQDGHVVACAHGLAPG